MLRELDYLAATAISSASPEMFSPFDLLVKHRVIITRWGSSLGTATSLILAACNHSGAPVVPDNSSTASTNVSIDPEILQDPKVAEAIQAAIATRTTPLPSSPSPEPTSTLPVSSKVKFVADQLPFIKKGRFTSAGHPYDPDNVQGVRGSVDFSTERPLDCNDRAQLSEWPVVAVKEGEVIEARAGRVRLRHPNEDKKSGTISDYLHLQGITVAEGRSAPVKAGEVIGFPSCNAMKVRPGDPLSPHLHLTFFEYTTDEKGVQQEHTIPLEQVELAGRSFVDDETPYEGKMIKIGEEERKADMRVCGPDEESIAQCKGRNDIDPSPLPRTGPVQLHSTPSPTVVPTPTSTRVPTATSTPRPRLTNTPAPNLTLTAFEVTSLANLTVTRLAGDKYVTDKLTQISQEAGVIRANQGPNFTQTAAAYDDEAARMRARNAITQGRSAQQSSTDDQLKRESVEIAERDKKSADSTATTIAWMGTSTPLVSPTSTPLPAIVPTEVERSLVDPYIEPTHKPEERYAEEAAFRYWRGLFMQAQGKRDEKGAYIRMLILSIGNKPVERILNDNDTQGDDTILARYRSEGLLTQRTNPPLWGSITGEVIVKDIKVVAGPNLATNVDRAERLLWRGDVVISAVTQHRGLFGARTEYQPRFLYPLSNHSSPKRERVTLSVRLQGDRWGPGIKGSDVHQIPLPQIWNFHQELFPVGTTFFLGRSTSQIAIAECPPPGGCAVPDRRTTNP